MNLIPRENPFAGPNFARVWDGWQGRRTRTLEIEGQRAHFVERPLGPVCTRAAMPFGVPVFVDDAGGRHLWLDRYFSLGRSLRSTASLFCAPSHTYPGVAWQTMNRAVVRLDRGWEERVKSSVRRTSRRAEAAGWEPTELDASSLRAASRVIRETDRRHGQPVRFDVGFFECLLAMDGPGPGVRIYAVWKHGEVGAFWVVFASEGYEFGWYLASTDDARADGAVPLLTLAWIETAARRGVLHVDLGASPSQSVHQFKSTFGAVDSPSYTGVRRWHLIGARA